MDKHTAGTSVINTSKEHWAEKLWHRLLCTKAVDMFNPNKVFLHLSTLQRNTWFQRMAKRSAVNDGLLTYRDELMEDPNHYRIMVPNDIQLQRHLSRPFMIHP